MMEFVKPQDDPNVNVVLYGLPKSGKTMGAASAPGPVLYLNADRGNATRFAHSTYGDKLREVKVEGLETLHEAEEVAASGDYATVVLDPVADVYRILLEQISKGATRPGIQHYGDAGTHLERHCRALCDLPVHAVFVCHAQEVQDEATGEFEHLPFVSTKSGSPVFAAKLLAMVDVIGYTGVVQEGEGAAAKNRYMATLVNRAGRRGGDRFGGVLGEARDVDLSEWIQQIHDAAKPQKAQAAK